MVGQIAPDPGTVQDTNLLGHDLYITTNLARDNDALRAHPEFSADPASHIDFPSGNPGKPSNVGGTSKVNRFTGGNHMVGHRAGNGDATSGCTHIVQHIGAYSDTLAGGNYVTADVLINVDTPPCRDHIALHLRADIHTTADDIKIICNLATLDHHLADFLCCQRRGNERCQQQWNV